jgi:hypothetical protein
MAIIYRYNLEFPCGNESYLRRYEKEIIATVIKHFGSNLKEVPRVTDDFFEFKLYNSVYAKELFHMGRRLTFVPRKRGGFRRMPQKFYALLYPPEAESEKTIYAEFIDAKDFDEWDRFRKQAHRYAIGLFEGRNRDIRNLVTDSTTLQNALYADVLSAEIEVDILHELAVHELTEPVVISMQGFHLVRANDNDNVFEDNWEYREKRGIRVTSDKIVDAIYLEELDVTEYNKKDDVFTLSLDSRKTVPEMSEIIEKLHFEIPDTDTVDTLNMISKDDELIFTLHNVGQGLATSLARRGEPPFLFFDFGMGEGANAKTRPCKLTGEVTPDATIVLSHIHKDHWFRLAIERNAYKCDWYIPKQLRGVAFRNKCAWIISLGGTVSTVSRTVMFAKGVLFCGALSTFKPSRLPSKKHETGLTLRIDTSLDGVDGGILVAGDQMYDYMDNRYLCDLHILVASHHGGVHTWSKGLPVPTPMPSGKALLIYSYGKSNTHGHPSHRASYASWRTVHETPINGDYCIII